ncbi:Cas10/Cmr2 second palm domain-containing protein [Thiorhodospira sibirica]|uniref:Cas10/Cmr2 second palm domain-containing protein n=1 Tax=Thiorhodospira sibirica TaxID=154347 RepID=UPI00022C5884|nr:type III-B CRISPR-associated protein Cas10/Cmr2 [Thiorhodospira sibirica]
MSETMQYFHLTLGPVQGFVAQARRTRDFWAGSFLLSWLASVAMLSVRQQRGEIDFPIPDEDFLKAMQGLEPKVWPEQGSVPNRFKAFGARVQADFDPQQVVSAVQQAWLALCQTVWEADLAVVLDAHSREQREITQKIWYRQLQAYWEISWCLTTDDTVSNLLDRRKNWRSHVLPDEPGIKCMMMEGFQELSGVLYPDQKVLARFWERLRGHLHGGELDLRDKECLSALGFVKRRFVRHFPKFETVLDNGVRLRGWSLAPQVPSLLYLAAAPWYAQVLRQAQKTPEVRASLEVFLAAAERFGGTTEVATPLRSVREAVVGCQGLPSRYAGIDGAVFHESALQLEQLRASPERAEAAAQLLRHLQVLRRAAHLSAPPGSFYAVLIMDGDSLGSQMSDVTKQVRISQGLNAFTQGVPARVKEMDGFLVYAGGDDVLALVTVERAVALAVALREDYRKCFEAQNQGQVTPVVTSLSGALIFAHSKNPLTFVLGEAHRVLDEVAKDQTGRDALAIEVLKPGGVHVQWSQPWAHLLAPEHRGNSGDLLTEVVRLFRDREAQSAFTNRFIFKVTEVLQRLPEDLLAQDRLLRALLKAELVHSGLNLEKTENREAQIQALLDPLLSLAVPHQRRTNALGQTLEIKSTGRFDGDGLKLVRFLAQGGLA